MGASGCRPNKSSPRFPAGLLDPTRELLRNQPIEKRTLRTRPQYSDSLKPIRRRLAGATILGQKVSVSSSLAEALDALKAQNGP
jgi:hypothetical protein